MIGLGCMRLSTDPDRDEARGIALLHAAFDAGIELLDTADTYCRDHTEIGHNERLIARALASWNGEASRIRVATKGGLIRPAGAWVEDGRAKHLREACAASRRALGVARLHLYQLHAPDPRTPFATSVRALGRLLDDGLVGQVGLCNVTLPQLEEGRRIVPVATVQVELSVWRMDAILSGVVPYCLANGIHLLAHRPLGGPQRRARLQNDATLAAIAARHGATPFEIALAWLMDLSPLVVPLPGATRAESVRSIARAAAIALTDQDREDLDARFPEARRVRLGAPAPRAAASTTGEIVTIMGLPGAGKSTMARSYVERGYARLNRDGTGGSLRDLLPAIDRLTAAGARRIVADNTYLSRKSRAGVIDAAARHAVLVRCVWLTTSVDDAQVNAVERMLAKYGRLLEPDEIRQLSRKDPGVFGPTALFRAARALEPPTEAEGFSSVEAVPFVRERDHALTNRAVIVWCDGILLNRAADADPSHTDGAVLSHDMLAARGARLKTYHEDGWRILGLSWQPQVSAGATTSAGLEHALGQMRERLGVPIAIAYCPHAAGPPACWCRKPLPGLGVLFIKRYQLDPAQCLYVAAGPQDPGFARRLGFRYVEAAEFFKGNWAVSGTRSTR